MEGGFMYALITVVRPRGADVDGMPSLVLIVGWFAHKPVEPGFVEYTPRSPWWLPLDDKMK
jgi:hypothetical protein